MTVIPNPLIPFKGYKCINLFGLVFVRSGKTVTATDIRHEAIHTAQMRELLYLPFYLWYVLEWLVRLLAFQGTRQSYRRIRFEREAYAHQDEENYLQERRHFAYLREKYR